MKEKNVASPVTNSLNTKKIKSLLVEDICLDYNEVLPELNIRKYF